MQRSLAFPVPKEQARPEPPQRVSALPPQASLLRVPVQGLPVWAAAPEREVRLRAVLPPRFVEEPPSRLDAQLLLQQGPWRQRPRQGASKRWPESTAGQLRVQAWAEERFCAALDAREQPEVLRQQALPVRQVSPEPLQQRVLPPCSAVPCSCELLPLVPAFWPEWPSSRPRAWKRGKDRFSE